jgi:hypothetical protein
MLKLTSTTRALERDCPEIENAYRTIARERRGRRQTFFPKFPESRIAS